MEASPPPNEMPGSTESVSLIESGASPVALAHLAVEIMKLDPGRFQDGVDQRLPFSDPKLDLAFHQALFRAQQLLKVAGGQSDKKVHAYQLFVEGQDLLSFSDIAKRFKEVGWSGLGTSNSVEKCVVQLVVNVDIQIKKFQQFVSERNDAIGVSWEEMASELRSFIDAVLTETALGKMVADSEIVKNRIFDIVSSACEYGESPRLDNDLLLDQRANECFCEYALFPQDPANFPKMDDRRAVSRKVRPYEIFLFAAQQNLQSERLVCRRSDLKGGFVPSPPHWTNRSILLRHRAALSKSEGC